MSAHRECFHQGGGAECLWLNLSSPGDAFGRQTERQFQQGLRWQPALGPPE